MNTSTVITAFEQDVLEGLSATPKRLPSKYFYDQQGDKLFQQIMQMPEYYLTDCEFEILDTHRQQLLNYFGPEQFDLIELGAGDGLKTKVLLGYFFGQNAPFQYYPIDISGHILKELEKACRKEWPDLPISPLQGDYFRMLDQLKGRKESRKVILFLGANIGNLEIDRAKAFLEAIRERMAPGDLLLIGFDLKKDPDKIMEAYSDPHGITAAFNLNLLTRMNRELGADFDLEQFKHWEMYNPETGATRSFILSKKAQAVHFTKLDTTIQFEAWESIRVELSQKFSLSGIDLMAEELGFEIVEHLTDSHSYFVDSLWRKPA